MCTLNDYRLVGILFLALLFVVIDLWSFENSRDFAKKRLSHYISVSVTKAIAGLQIRALLQLLGCLFDN